MDGTSSFREPARRGRPPDPTLGPRLLDGARSLLVEGGLNALNADRLARRAGAGKAAVYRRWPDLVDLAAEVVLTADLVPAAAVDASTGADLTRLAAWWSAPLTVPERAAAALLGTDRHHPVLREAFARSLDVPLLELAGRLLAHADAGTADPGSTGLVARLLRAQVVGRLASGPVPTGTAADLARDVLAPVLARARA